MEKKYINVYSSAYWKSVKNKLYWLYQLPKLNSSPEMANVKHSFCEKPISYYMVCYLFAVLAFSLPYTFLITADSTIGQWRVAHKHCISL